MNMNDKPNTMPELLTVDQVAEHIQCSPWTVRAWIKDGQLDHVRMGRRLIRVKRTDLETFVSRNGIDEQRA